MTKKVSISVTDIILLILSGLFVAGIHTFFAPCGPKEDGSWMVCHWAGQAEVAFSFVLFLISLAHAFIPNSLIKTGLSIAMIPTALAAALLPGNLINLCMIKTMRCHTIMHPAVILVCVLIILCAGLDIFLKNKNK